MANVDPTAFQLLVNLLIVDAWSLDSIKSLKLPPNNLFSLFGICRRFEITKAIKTLEEVADDFIQSLDKTKDKDELLEISRENLETIFLSEKIPLDGKEIFHCASRWASNQCTIKGLEHTEENYREVLGSYLLKVRFPTMSTQEFTKVGLLKKDVSKADENLVVYEYIGLGNDEKANYDKSQLPFGTKRRKLSTSFSSAFSVLSLPPQYKLTTSPSFVCDGKECWNWKSFQVSQKISLHGFGFLGPIDGDTNFDVTVQIRRVVNGSFASGFDSGTFTKTIFARKGKIFHFLLDEPIAVESTAYDSYWGYFYRIDFTLKGPSNIPQYKVDDPKDESYVTSGVQFHLHSRWNNGNPLAELLFKKI